MANYLKGEGRAAHRGFLGSAAQLPPRSPFFPSAGVSYPDLVTSLYSHQNSRNAGGSQRQHLRTPSCSLLTQEQPSWLNDLLDDPEVPKKKSSHRRCASDSFTYLGNPGSLYTISNIAEEEEFDCTSVTAPLSHELSNADHVESDQLTVLLEEIQQLQQQQNLPISVRMQPSSFKYENITENTEGACSTIPNDSSSLNINCMVRAPVDDLLGPLIYRPEVDSLEDEDLSPQHGTAGDSASSVAPFDPNLDPKRAKRPISSQAWKGTPNSLFRVLANRQSAQRSRVRKLQYIAELERSVNVLQNEVSTLSPQVVYLEHQLALLNMNNNALKLQIAIYMRDKKFMDSQNEVLKKEIQRLQKLHQFQLLHQGQKQKQQLQQLHQLQRHSSLPSDFNVQSHQYYQLNLGSQQAKCDSSFSDSLNGLMKSISGISLGDGSSDETVSENERLMRLEVVFPPAAQFL